ncbi:hypothetical protein PC39_02330 [Salinisphaera sp. PC39]
MIAVAAHCTEDELVVVLADGRTISTPLSWFPRLREADPESRGNCQLMAGGRGIHWPDLDEDIAVLGLLEGIKAH